jgi:NADH:ubiquinone oxidoreductase subunit 3 (subunit A)
MMDTFWALFVDVGMSALLLTFGVGETYALATGRQSFTEWIRVQLGITPRSRRRLWAPMVFVVVLVLFNVWFIPHILDLWPWER